MNNKIIGFFLAVEHNYHETSDEFDYKVQQFEEFKKFVWGKDGVALVLEQLEFSVYGEDIHLILYECYVFPSN